MIHIYLWPWLFQQVAGRKSLRDLIWKTIYTYIHDDHPLEGALSINSGRSLSAPPHAHASYTGATEPSNTRSLGDSMIRVETYRKHTKKRRSAVQQLVACLCCLLLGLLRVALLFSVVMTPSVMLLLVVIWSVVASCDSTCLLLHYLCYEKPVAFNVRPGLIWFKSEQCILQ